MTNKTKLDNSFLKEEEDKKAPAIKEAANQIEIKNKESINEIKKSLSKNEEIISTIISSLISGVHYSTIEDKPYLNQGGADYLARATGIRVKFIELEEKMKPEINFISYKFKAIGFIKGLEVGEATASINSLEQAHRKVFETFNAKTKQWEPKPNKSVFDVLNTIIQKGQIRAKKKLIRNLLGIADRLGQDPELIDDPKASSRKQMSVYQTLYKFHFNSAPIAPKQITKKGKRTRTTDKEQQEWKKEWVRINIFKPYLLENGLPPTNWSVKEVEKIKEDISNITTKKGGQNA